MKKHYTRKEAGVALLFALGILSLLLVMGLAFVTNSILARKVAYNNSSRSQAKMLAHSAISRVALSIMMYQYQAAATPSLWPNDFSGICSYDENDNKAFSDQLNDINYSLLNYPANDVGYEGYKSPAKWIFFYDGESKVEGGAENIKRKIIGRVAYQIFPNVMTSRINMQAVLSGFRPNSGRIPWNQRWGVGIEELCVDNTTAFTGKTDSAAHWSNTAPVSGEIPGYYDSLYAGFGTTFFPEEDGGKSKKWLEFWLSEGTVATEPEAFYYELSTGKRGLSHRFNLGEDLGEDFKFGIDAWYDRFHADATYQETFLTAADTSSNKNSIVEEIARDAKDFKTTDKRAPLNSGLPFFKQIGKDSGTFGSTEILRRQIVANFNDYCDSDSIPTSDVWAGTSDTKTTSWNNPNLRPADEPKYTGNEETPYIYEVGFSGEIMKDASSAGVNLNAEKTLDLGLKITPAAKLVNIYYRLNPYFTKFQFFAWLQQVELTLTVTKLTYKGVTFQDSATTPNVVSKDVQLAGVWKTAKITWANDLNADPQITNQITNCPITIDFDNNESTFIGNYAFKVAGSAFLCPIKEKIAVTPEIKDITTEQINTSLGLTGSNVASSIQTPGTIEVSEVKVDIRYWPGRLVLMGIPASGSSPAFPNGIAVDMVRTPEPSGTDGISTGESENAFDPATSYFVFGGMHGIDPRQNLNWGDWEHSTTIKTFLSTESIPWQEVMAVSDAGAGVVNSHALAAPNNSASTEKDSESTADPAWKGDGSSAHISTAFIRNAPMKSPWELGLIHRAKAWQTINLKKACSPSNPADEIKLVDHEPGQVWSGSGTSYSGGDGGILDQIKMTPNARSFGKIDLNELSQKKNSPSTDYDTQIVNSLFANIICNQEIVRNDRTGKSFDAANISDSDSLKGEEKVIGFNDVNGMIDLFAASRVAADPKFDSRAQFLNDAGVDWGNGKGLVTNSNDAQQEELIGKTVNLVNASPGSLPGVVTVLIVAQTIRDIGGVGSDIPIVRLKQNQDPLEYFCKLGRFDIAPDDSTGIPDGAPEKNIYFDEITGEVKILVTLVRYPDNGRIMVRKIEYID